MGKHSVTDTAPGSVAVHYLLVIMGRTFGAIAFVPDLPPAVLSLLGGFAASMFLAGVIGLVNIQILSKEISSKVFEPLLNSVLYARLRDCGLLDVFPDRAKASPFICDSISRADKIVVIIGSSLNGLIGKGTASDPEHGRVRSQIIAALKRDVKVEIIMTHPRDAHLRAEQEKKSKGDIEYEIIETLIYLTGLKFSKENPSSERLSIKLYNATPTIFCLITENVMVMNPYPYFAKACDSTVFAFERSSAISDCYYKNHYQGAYSNSKTVIVLEEDKERAVQQIRDLILEKNIEGNVIPDEHTRNELVEKLQKMESTRSSKC